MTEHADFGALAESLCTVRAADAYGEFAHRCQLYEERKRAWLDEHPGASSDDTQDALRLISLEVGL